MNTSCKVIDDLDQKRRCTIIRNSWQNSYIAWIFANSYIVPVGLAHFRFHYEFTIDIFNKPRLTFYKARYHFVRLRNMRSAILFSVDDVFRKLFIFMRLKNLIGSETFPDSLSYISVIIAVNFGISVNRIFATYKVGYSGWISYFSAVGKTIKICSKF